MTEKENSRILYEGLIANPKIKGLPKTYEDFKTNVLDNPANRKVLYDGLIKNPAIKGLPKTYQDFEKTMLPKVPVASTDTDDNFLETAGKFVSKASVILPFTAGLVGAAYNKIMGPSDSAKREALEDASKLDVNQGLPPEEATAKLIETTTKAQSILSGGVEGPVLGQRVSDNILKLGYKYKTITNEDGSVSTIAEKDLTPKTPEVRAELEQDKVKLDATYNKKIADITKAYDSMIAADKAATEQLVPGRTFASSLPIIGPAFKTARRIQLEAKKEEEIKKVLEEKANVLGYYTDALGGFETAVDKATDLKTGMNPFQPLATVDVDNPESINATFDYAAKNLPNYQRKPDNFDLQDYVNRGIDYTYYADPATAERKRAFYGTGMYKDDSNLSMEQQGYAFTAMQADRNALNSIIAQYSEQKQELDTTVSNLVKAQKEGKNLSKEQIAAISNYSLLSSRLGDFLKEQKANLEGLTNSQKEVTKAYQEYLGGKKEQERVSEFAAPQRFGAAVYQGAESLALIPSKMVKAEVSLLNRLSDDVEAKDRWIEKTSTKDLSSIKPEFTEATPIQLVNEKGEWDFDINGASLVYNSTKVAGESFLLGLGMMGASRLVGATFGEALLASAARVGTGVGEATGATGLRSLAGSTFSLGVKDAALGAIAQGGARATVFATEALVGSAVPSVLIFQDEILKSEMAKGLTFDEAYNTSLLLAVIEGLTERISPNEMNFVKQLIGSGTIKNLAQLSQNEVYKKAITSYIYRQTGKNLSEKGWRFLTGSAKGFAKAGARTVFEEGNEEVVGLFGQDFFVNPLGRSYNEDYKGEEFTAANILNTYIATAATMLPMAITSGRGAVANYTQTQKDAQYMVGSGAAPYYQTTLDLYKDGLISKGEFERRSAHIRNLETLAADAKNQALSNPKIKDYTEDQLTNYKQQIFSKLVDKHQLESTLKTTLKESDKEKILESYAKVDTDLRVLLRDGIFKTEAERVTKTDKSLDFYLSDKAVKGISDIKAVNDLITKIDDYAATEKDENLKKKYVAKSALLKEQRSLILKKATEAAKSAKQKAEEANVNGKVKVISLQDGSPVEEDLEFNKEYVLGRKLSFDSAGGLEFSYPEFKIVSQNEDSTLNIEAKNSKGETVTMVKPVEFFADYSIGSKEDLQKNPLGRYYAKYGDRKFSLKMNSSDQAKAKTNLKTVNGILSFEDGKLYFNFVDEKGKKKYLELSSQHIKNQYGRELSMVSKPFRGVRRNVKGKTAAEKVTWEDLNEFDVVTESDILEHQEALKKLDVSAMKAREAKATALRYKVVEDFINAIKAPLTALEAEITDLVTEIKGLDETLTKLSKLKESTEVVATDLEGLLTKKKVSELMALDQTQPSFAVSLAEALEEKIQKLLKKRNKVAAEIESIRSKQAALEPTIQEELDLVAKYIDVEDEDFTADNIKSKRKALLAGIRESKVLIASLEGILKDVNNLIDKALANFRAVINAFTKRFPDFNTLPPSEELDGLYLQLEEATKEAEVQYGIQALEVKAGDVTNEIKELENKIKQYQKESKFLKKLYDVMQAENEKILKLREEFNKKELLKLMKDKSLELGSETGTTDPEAPEAEEFKKSATSEAAKKSVFQWYSSTISSGWGRDGQEYVDNPEHNYGNRRFQQLSLDLPSMTNMFLVLLNKDTAKTYGLEGLIHEPSKDTHVVAVVARKTFDGYVFVDYQGNDIPKERLNPTTAVYTHLMEGGSTWSDGEVSYRDKELRGKTTEEQEALVRSASDAYKAFRKTVLESKEPVGVKITSVSNGIPNIEPSKTVVDDEGVVTKEYTNNPVTEVLVDPSLDLDAVQVIKVAAIQNVGTPGVGFITMEEGTVGQTNVPLGVPIFSHQGKKAFLNNTKFTPEEARKLANIVAVLFYTAKNNVLSGSKDVLDKDILAYLKKVVFWRNPYYTKKDGEEKKDAVVSPNQMWIDGKGLNMGYSFIPFINDETFEENLEQNLEALEVFFGDAFHSVDNKDLVKKVFNEITGIKSSLLDKEGRIIPEKLQKELAKNSPDVFNIVSWDSYQNYLLSATEHDGKTPRKRIPLTTNIVKREPLFLNGALNPEHKVQFPGRYMGFSFPNQAKPQDQQAPATTAVQPPASTGTSILDAPTDEVAIGGYLGQNYTPAMVQEALGKFQRLKAITPGRYIYTSSKNVVISEADIDIQNGSFVVTNLELKNGPFDVDFDTAETFEKYLNDMVRSGYGLGGIFTFVKALDKPVETPTAPTTTATTTTTTTTPPATGKGVKLKPGLFKKTPNTPPDSANFRIAKKGPYTVENILKAKEWLNSVLPQVSFTDVVGLIDGVAWGQFKDNGIILSNLAEEGTIFHEAFEAVKGLFITDRENYTINKKFRARKGSFVDRETGLSVPYSKATDAQIKEEIAEEYREFALTGKRWDGEVEKMNLFQRIWNMINNFLFGADIDIQEVFDRISSGYYKDKMPIPRNRTSMGGNYRIAGKEDAVFLYTVNQSVTAELFSELYRSGSNITVIFSNANNDLKTIYNAVANKISNQFALSDEFLEVLDKHNGDFYDAIIEANDRDIEMSDYILDVLRKKAQDEFTPELAAEISNAYDGATYILENWDAVRDTNIDYLKTNYKISITKAENTVDAPIEGEENDVEESTEAGDLEDQKNLKDYSFTDFSLDVKETASNRVKLLIASLRKAVLVKNDEGIIELDENGLPRVEIYKNDLGLSEPVDYWQTFRDLLNIVTSNENPVTNFPEFMEALENNIVNHPEFYTLYYRLKGKSDILTPQEFETQLDVAATFTRLKYDFQRFLLDKREKQVGDEVFSYIVSKVINSKENRDINIIKQEWLSNLGEVRNSSSGLIYLDPETSSYKFDTSKLKHQGDLTLEGVVKFLAQLGIEFETDFDVTPTVEKNAFLSVANNLRGFILTNNAEVVLGKDPNFVGQLNLLAEFEYKQTKKSKELGHYTINGEQQYDITGVNTFGLVSKDMNKSADMDELLIRNPHFKDPSVRFSGWRDRILFKKGKKTSTRIVIGSSEGTALEGEQTGKHTSKLDASTRLLQEFAFNLKGIFSIIVPADAKTEHTYSFRNRETEQGTLFVDSLSNPSFAYDTYFKNYLINEILGARDFKTNSEKQRVLNFRPTQLTKYSGKRKVGESLAFFEDILRLDYSEVVDTEFTTEAEALNFVNTWVNENAASIKADLEDFLERLEEETKAMLLEEEVVENLGGTYRFNGLDRDRDSDIMSGSELDKLIKLRTLNYTINIFEQFNMFWGNPNQYKDLTKRIKPFTSTREPSIYDTVGLKTGKFFDDFFNENFNVASLETEGESSVVQLSTTDRGFVEANSTITGIVLEDNNVVLDTYEETKKELLNDYSISFFGLPYDKVSSKAKEILEKKFGKFISAYEGIEETDGQAKMILPVYREFMKRSIMWSDLLEELYQYDMAYERDRTNSYKGKNKKKLKELDKKILDKGNPNVQRAKDGLDPIVYPVLKPIGAGPKKGENFINTLEKMSLVPLFYRGLEKRDADGNVIPSNGIAYYNWLASQKIGYVRYKSANKVGTQSDASGKVDKLYNTDGSLSMPKNPNTDIIQYKFFGIQVETRGQKDSGTRGTQLTKLATANLLNSGIPVDIYYPALEAKLEELIAANSISDPSTLNTEAEVEKYLEQLQVVEKDLISYLKTQDLSSPVGDLVNQHTKVLDVLTSVYREELFDRLGITQEDGNWIISNIEQFISIIKDELTSRKSPKNIIDAIRKHRVGNQLVIPLDMLPGGEKIESLLLSFIDKNICRPKMFGGAKPQVSSALFEGTSRRLAYKNAEGEWINVNSTSEVPDGITPKILSNDLHFYTKEEPWIEVELPAMYKDALGEYLYKDIPHDLLKAIGFRIPTQGLNSVENIRIKGFLPESYGDMLVVPSAITTKAGSDFDIDKLNLYMFNYFINKETGKPEKVQFLDDTNSTAKERYKNYVRSRVKDLRGIRADVKAYSEEYQEVKSQVKANLAAYKQSLKDAKSDLFGTYEAKIDAISAGIESDKQETEKVYDEGYSIFKKLPKSIAQQFMETNKKLEALVQSGKMPRFEKTLNFKHYAQQWIDALETDVEIEYTDKQGEVKVEQVRHTEAVKVLNELITNYDLFLITQGWTVEKIQEHNAAIAKLKENSEVYKELKQNLFSSSRSQMQQLTEEFDKMFDQTLAETFNLLPESEFGKLSIEEQNSKKALENKYIETLIQLLELKQNYRQLMTPNSADILKDQAKVIDNLEGVSEDSSFGRNGRFLSSVENLKKRIAFQIGKDGIGIAAVGITNHSLNQMVDAWLGTQDLTKQQAIDEIEIYFGINNVVIRDKDGNVLEKRASLSFIKDSEGNWISDNLSAYINSFVDIAKDEYIFRLNANLETAGTMIIANKMGIGIEHLTLLFKQPIIQDYVNLNLRRKGMLGKMKGITAADIKLQIEDKYGSHGTKEEKRFTIAELKEMIKNADSLTTAQKEKQVTALRLYETLTELNNDMRDVQSQYNYDTASITKLSSYMIKSHNAEVVADKRAKGTNAVQGDYLTGTFFGNTAATYGDFVKSLSPLFLTQEQEILEILNPIFSKFYGVYDADEREKAILNIRRGFINYLLLTTPVTIDGKTVTIGNKFHALLVGPNNVSKELRVLQRKVKNKDIPSSFALEKLFGMTANEERKTNNIKLFDKVKDPEYANLITMSLEEMRNNSIFASFINNLYLASLNQSGISLNVLSFSQFISNNSFIIPIMQQIIDKMNAGELSYGTFLPLFYANSWKNIALTPKFRGVPRKNQSTGKIYFKKYYNSLGQAAGGYNLPDVKGVYITSPVFTNKGKISTFVPNINIYQFKTKDKVKGKEGEKDTYVDRLFQQVTDDKGVPILVNARPYSITTPDGVVVTGYNADILYKEVQLRGNGIYGMEYGRESFLHPKIETLSNAEIIRSLPTATLSIDYNKLINQTFRPSAPTTETKEEDPLTNCN